jgi:hypothetical protein
MTRRAGVCRPSARTRSSKWSAGRPSPPEPPLSTSARSIWTGSARWLLGDDTCKLPSGGRIRAPALICSRAAARSGSAEGRERSSGGASPPRRYERGQDGQGASADDSLASFSSSAIGDLVNVRTKSAACVRPPLAGRLRLSLSLRQRRRRLPSAGGPTAAALKAHNLASLLARPSSRATTAHSAGASRRRPLSRPARRHQQWAEPTTGLALVSKHTHKHTHACARSQPREVRPEQARGWWNQLLLARRRHDDSAWG